MLRVGGATGRVKCRLRTKDGSAIAPWQTLAEQYSILEDELKIRIFAIAESEANFSAEIAAKRRRGYGGGG